MENWTKKRLIRYIKKLESVIKQYKTMINNMVKSVNRIEEELATEDY